MSLSAGEKYLRRPLTPSLPHWTLPSIFRSPEVLTEVEVTEAEAELKALQRHALEVVDPETGL